VVNSLLARHCAGLTEVNLEYCEQLTEGGIGELARNCARLTTVNVSNCYKLTDGGIGDFKRQLPNCSTEVKKFACSTAFASRRLAAAAFVLFVLFVLVVVGCLAVGTALRKVWRG
jgi:hypothetical protein